MTSSWYSAEDFPIVDTDELPVFESVDITVDEGEVEEYEMVGMRATEVESEFTVEGGMLTTMLASEAFADGLSMVLATDLDDILSDEDEELPDMNELVLPNVSPDVVDELAVDAGQAETLLKVVYQTLDDHQAEYGTLPSQIVIGLPQFKTLEAYVQSECDTSLEQRLPVDEVIVVPGPQLHAVCDPYQMLKEDVTDETE